MVWRVDTPHYEQVIGADIKFLAAVLGMQWGENHLMYQFHDAGFWKYHTLGEELTEPV